MSRLFEGHLKIDRLIGNSLVSIYKQAVCSPLNKGPGVLNLIVFALGEEILLQPTGAQFLNRWN
jgi:hypothetical protein